MMLGANLNLIQARNMSVATNFKTKFEEAYTKKMELQSRVPPKM